MKTTKRFLSIMLIAIMTFCLSAFNVSAAHTITVTGAIPKEQFKAYKLFAVEYEDAGADSPHDYTIVDDCVLGKDTTAYTVAGFQELTAANKQSYVNDLYKRYIMNNSNANVADTKEADSNGNATFTLDDGYYLIINESETNADGPDSTVSFVMCDTNDDNISIPIKRDQPTLTKEIQHNENSTNSDEGWGNVGDNKIGDDVNFRLISKMPEYTWEGYQFIIHDELSSGLTVPTKVKVKIGDSDEVDVDVSQDGGAQKFKIDLSDKVLENEGKDVLVTYSATLNTNAKIASQKPDKDNCETNEAYLTFSNNPYNTGTDGDTTDTKEVKVYDWTFTVNIEKIDGTTKEKLNGAVFELYDKDGKEVNVSPDGSDYKVDPNASSNEITVTSSGVKIKGLDDFYEYKLVETKAPTGYKTPTGDDAITLFKINAEYESAPNMLSKLEAAITSTASGAESSGINITIPNTTGKKLVGTGGIGTTIFYIAGGVLMAGAAVLLIVRKRTNK